MVIILKRLRNGVDNQRLGRQDKQWPSPSKVFNTFVFGEWNIALSLFSRFSPAVAHFIYRLFSNLSVALVVLLLPLLHLDFHFQAGKKDDDDAADDDNEAQPCMLFLDSLNMHSSAKIWGNLRK